MLQWSFFLEYIQYPTTLMATRNPALSFSEKRRLFEGRRNGGGCFIGAKTVELWLCFSTTSSFKTKRFTWKRRCFKALERWTSSTGLIPKKKGANVMIRFFWWSDPASLDTKEPKAMFLFSQKDILMHWTKISLVAISKCGSKTPQTWDDIYHENLRVPLARCPNSQTLVVKMWSSIGSVYIDTKKLVQKKCLLLLIDKIQHLSIGIVDIVWVFIDVHSLSH